MSCAATAAETLNLPREVHHPGACMHLQQRTTLPRTFGTSTSTIDPSAPAKVTTALPVAVTCFLSFTMSLQNDSAAYTRVVEALPPLFCVGACCSRWHRCIAEPDKCSADIVAIKKSLVHGVSVADADCCNRRRC